MIYRKSYLWLLLIVTILIIVSNNIFWQKDLLSVANTIASTEQPLIIALNENLLQQGKELYDRTQYSQAAIVLEQAVTNYNNNGKFIEQAIALSNLSLVYQKLGNWQKARESITASLAILKENSTIESRNILAQALDIQGKLFLTIGKVEAALSSWEVSEKIYLQLGDNEAEISSKINQAQALQDLGFYRRAVKILLEVEKSLKIQPDSQIKVVGLRSLGDALQLISDFDRALELLQQSLNLAEKIGLTREVGIIYLSLGNNYRNRKNPDIALQYYQKTITSSVSEITQYKARLNSFSLLLESQQVNAAASLLPAIKTNFNNLPVSRSTVYGKIKLAQELIDNSHSALLKELSPKDILLEAIAEANNLGDQRSESHGLGTLGNLYEREKQFPEALKLTEKAIVLARSINANDILYLWQWQTGRIYKKEVKISEAIAAYDEAIINLQSLRQDLVAVDREIQFNFRDRVEPIYRQAVELLFQGEVNASKLDKARRLIEALQLAELDNFFRESCLNNRPVILDEIVDRNNPNTAIIYPIILEDRLEVIVKIPHQYLHHYTTKLPHQEIETTLSRLQEIITEPDRNKETRLLSQQVYNWTIEPIETELKQSGVDTLVFVPDSSFRNLPLASLYDGKQYLIEKYAIALNPALQLFSTNTPTITEYNAIAAGLTKPPLGYDRFSPLPEVKSELDTISSTGVITTKLIDHTFTSTSLAANIDRSSYQIVHLATHGQFSSQASDTFILAADGPIDALELEKLLHNSQQNPLRAIELLVLSACETAAGDDRAALGLAGMAVKAGTKSTLASLWQIDDRSTAILIGEFYRELVTGKVSKAEALRRAQIKLLQNYPDYNRPMYWAAYVLVGSWL
jgi:CHAT domain-containing protein